LPLRLTSIPASFARIGRASWRSRTTTKWTKFLNIASAKAKSCRMISRSRKY